ncbi:FAD:protein FMN transferase [Psychroflexus sp. ALD_RP9]|uniref:FAD:protein FMN transferase n=1 Tax=Psychroflexus sp. ALD_RP9 TaxID=2777186 RepID=UPI001A901A57|nr:FAD:protein FMN transferase [Psychroflexus sp. ALD_RP9]QSS97034.1 FAD:protein FMN transferase [Psychroflexus sp. ALD_RP9]
MKSKYIGYAFLGAIVIIIAFVIFRMASTGNEANTNTSIKNFLVYEGQVYGTYFSIIYKSPISYKTQIDSIFNSIDQAASAYISNSEINVLNNKRIIPNSSKILKAHFNKAKDLYEVTNAYFDPTISPVIELWGFGKNTTPNVDSLKIELAMQRVGFSESYQIIGDTISLKNNAVINFTAMGEGFAIDEISNFLASKNISDFKVEIGGELQARGESSKQKPWLIGIENPLYDENQDLKRFLATVEVSNLALSTSGSYRKYFIDESGVKRSHIINPKTGYPVNHTLISVSVLAETSTKADAYATAIMAMGLEQGKVFIKNKPDLEAFLIFETADGIDVWSSSQQFKMES